MVYVSNLIQKTFKSTTHVGLGPSFADKKKSNGTVDRDTYHVSDFIARDSDHRSRIQLH